MDEQSEGDGVQRPHVTMLAAMTTNDDQNPTTDGLPSYGSVPPPPEGSYPPPPPGGMPAPGGYGGVPQQNKKALWSMILGILGLVCCGFFTGIPAIILGNQAKQEIAASGGTQTGEGMAKAGFILGIIAIVFGVISIILIVSGSVSYS